MRRRPKLNKAIQQFAPWPITETQAHDFVEAIDRVVYAIEKRTRERDRNEWWRRMSDLLSAQEAEKSVRGWALRLCDDIRHLEVRCSFLYHAALDHGATPDELAYESRVETSR